MNHLTTQMMKAKAENDVRRILVALDATPRCMASLEMAAGLAAHMRAQLETLFVEDVNLLRLAGLPFAKELDRASGEARSMDEAGIESALSAHVERLKRRLEWFSKNKQIEYNLRTVRGDYFTEAMHAESDILFMFASNRVSMVENVSVGRIETPRSTGWGRSPVYTIYQGDSESDVALQLAEEIAKMLGTELIVVLPPDTEDTLKTMRDQISKQLVGRMRLNIKIAHTDFVETTAEIGRSNCGLLVLPRHVKEVGGDRKKALQSLHCPVVIAG